MSITEGNPEERPAKTSSSVSERIPHAGLSNDPDVLERPTEHSKQLTKRTPLLKAAEQGHVALSVDTVEEGFAHARLTPGEQALIESHRARRTTERAGVEREKRRLVLE